MFLGISKNKNFNSRLVHDQLSWNVCKMVVDSMFMHLDIRRVICGCLGSIFLTMVDLWIECKVFIGKLLHSLLGIALKDDFRFRFRSIDHSLPRDIIHKARTKLLVIKKLRDQSKRTHTKIIIWWCFRVL